MISSHLETGMGVKEFNATQAHVVFMICLIIKELKDHSYRLKDKTASVPYRQRPTSSASSASAPRRWSQSTGPASHPAPASSSHSSANRRPPSPHSGSMVPEKKNRRLLYLAYLHLQPGGHCCRCWRGAHVWEPLVNQLILNGNHLTGLLLWKASDQRAPGADKQGSPLHEPAGGFGDRWEDKEIFIFPWRVSLCLFLSVRALWSLMSLLRPQSALHLCWQLHQYTETGPETSFRCLQNKCV